MHTHESPPPPLTLTDLAATMGRSWRVLATGSAAGLALGITTHLATPPRFEAVATVRVDTVPVDAPTGGPAPGLDMTAEEGIARSRHVAVAASALVDPAGDRVVEDVERSVTVSAVEGSSVLRVVAAAPTARSSAAFANAVANAYLATRSLDAMTRSDRLRSRVRGGIETSDGAVRAELEAAMARLELADLRGGSVIDPARAPLTPTGPGAALSALAGLLLGVLGAAPVAAHRCFSRSRGAPVS